MTYSNRIAIQESLRISESIRWIDLLDNLMGMTPLYGPISCEQLPILHCHRHLHPVESHKSHPWRSQQWLWTFQKFILCLLSPLWSCWLCFWVSLRKMLVYALEGTYRAFWESSHFLKNPLGLRNLPKFTQSSVIHSNFSSIRGCRLENIVLVD